MNNYDIKCRIIEEELRSVWPGWHVVRRLGGGSFGDVFQIYRDNYGIRVDSALKVIQVDDWMATVAFPSGSLDENQPDIPDALRSEIQIMEALRGAPNIVSIEDFAYRRAGQTSTLLVRMELLKSLQEVLPGRNGQGTLSSIGEIRKLGTDICRALMYCEKKGIIHRDIKPANLFVDRFGDYKVGDFGASKRMDTVHVAQTMTGIGTISYMAPEIFRGQSYNNTVDIYALGLVVYQLLNNGRMPFLPDTGSYTTRDIDSANYHRMNGTPIPSLSGKYVKGERIDSRLDAVVRKACSMNAADRYQTAKEFYDALTLTETAEKKSEAEYAKRPQGFRASAAPSQSRRQEGRPERIEIQQPAPQPNRHAYSQSGEKRSSGGMKAVIVVALVCIIAVSALAVNALRSSVGTAGSSAETHASSAEDRAAGPISDSWEESVAGSSAETHASSAEDRAAGPISDSWEEIVASGEDGTYLSKYRIGDTKELDLGEKGVIEMELVAFDADELADGSGTAHMTWIAKDLLTVHVMNGKNTSAGGWPASGMRAWLQDSILPLFPDPVQSSIKEVKKYSYTAEETISSSDMLWLPSHREVLGADDVYESRGPEYTEVFSDDTSRIRQRGGQARIWWLRSAYASGTSSFCSINHSGGAHWTYAKYGTGVCVGFCI